MVQKIELVCVEYGFEELRRVKQSSEATVNMTQKAFDRYAKVRAYCEKDQCSPRVVLNFKNNDGETLRLRIYPQGGGSPLRRNSEDVRGKDVSKTKRKGVLYWVHTAKNVKLI